MKKRDEEAEEEEEDEEARLAYQPTPREWCDQRARYSQTGGRQRLAPSNRFRLLARLNSSVAICRLSLGNWKIETRHGSRVFWCGRQRNSSCDLLFMRCKLSLQIKARVKRLLPANCCIFVDTQLRMIDCSSLPLDSNCLTHTESARFSTKKLFPAFDSPDSDSTIYVVHVKHEQKTLRVAVLWWCSVVAPPKDRWRHSNSILLRRRFLFAFESGRMPRKKHTAA